MTEVARTSKTAKTDVRAAGEPPKELERHSKSLAVVCIDGAADPDNTVLALLAAKMFKNIAICVTARPVSRNPHGPLEATKLSQADIEESRKMQEFNAKRVKAHLEDAGHPDALVYTGLDITETDLTTNIPHGEHSDETDEAFDIFNVARTPADRYSVKKFDELVSWMRSQDGEFAFLVGGPFTEVARLLELSESQFPDLKEKFGPLFAQGSFYHTRGTVSRPKVTMDAQRDTKVQPSKPERKGSFNMANDQDAAEKTRKDYPNTIVTVASDITRKDEVSYRDPSAMTHFLDQIYRLYAAHHQKTIVEKGFTHTERPEEPLWLTVNDAAVALGMEEFLDALHNAGGGGIDEIIQFINNNTEQGHGLYKLRRDQNVSRDAVGPRLVVYEQNLREDPPEFKRRLSRYLAPPEVRT